MRATLALVIWIGMAAAAMATETGPVIAIPGRPGAPVIINGQDASYAIVEGEWGLALHFREAARVYGAQGGTVPPEVGHYYPTERHKPGYGRLEIEPPANRPLPQPAESYTRSWSAQSAPPAPQPQYEVPAYPPPVVEAPQQQRPRPRPPRPYRPNGFRPDLR